MNPKKIQALMRQMGMSQEEIDANRVIIEKDEGNIVIENPSIAKIDMQGQTNFQISGDIREESKEAEISQEDIDTIVEKTGCSQEQAKAELEKTGDIAEAIINLS